MKCYFFHLVNDHLILGWCITRGQLFGVISRLKRSTDILENKVFLFQKVPQQFYTGSMAFLAIFCLCLVVPEIDFQGWFVVRK